MDELSALAASKLIEQYHGELKSYFSQWQVLHYFEGVLTNPDRAVAQIVCRKPAKLS